ALLHLTAHQEDPKLAPRLKPLLTSTWQCLWARWERSSPHRVLVGGGRSVAVGRIDNDLLIVSGGDDGTIRVWNARTGEPWGRGVIRGLSGSVDAVAVGEVDGDQVIVSGDEAGTLRMWRVRTDISEGIKLRAHRGSVGAVAIGRVGSQPVIVSADD